MKEIAKSSFLLLPQRAITILIVGREITMNKVFEKKKQRTGNKNEAEKIKSVNFRGNKRESNTAIMILGKWAIGTNHHIHL